MSSRRLVALGSLLVLAGCQGDRVVSPDSRLPGGPNFEISSGNPQFAWRPPIANQSATGVFNPALAPQVEICRTTGGPATCEGPFTAAVSGDKYQVDWKSPSAPGTFRIEVTISIEGTQTVVGFADVNTNAGALPGHVKLKAGSTLPINFNLTYTCGEADCFVDPATGGTVTFPINGSIAGVTFPPQEEGGDPIRVSFEVCNPGLEANGLLVFGSCITIDTNLEGQLTNPAIVFICDVLEDGDLPPDPEGIELHRRHGNQQIEVLPNAQAPACGTVGGNATVGSVIRALARGEVKTAGKRLLSLLGPKPLYALHLGAGGSTGTFSDFQFAAGGFDFGQEYAYLSGVTIEDHTTTEGPRSNLTDNGTVPAPSGWPSPSFTPTTPWPTGQAAFGAHNGTNPCPVLTTQANTSWPLFTNILLRRNFSTTAGTIEITVRIDNDVQIWLDGVNITKLAGATANGHVELGGSGDDDDWFVHFGCADVGPAVITIPVSAGVHTLALRGDDYGVQSHLDAKVVFTPSGGGD